MPEILSRLDCYQIGRSYLVARAKKIDPTRVDVAGSDANLFVGSQSFVAAAIAQQLADRLDAVFLASAVGEDLDRWGFDRYEMTRKGAQAAVTPVRFYRTTALAGGGSIPLGTKIVSLSNIEYITTTTATFAASDLSQTANARAVQAGRDFQVGKNQIQRIQKPAALFDPSMQVNNDVPSSGGDDRELDPDYKQRLRKFWRAQRRGTKGAIEFGATTVVASANATEALNGLGQPARVVTLFIADAAGVANAALAKEVDNVLLDWRACGIAVITSTSVPQIVPLQLRLAFGAAVDTESLTESIVAALVEYVNSLPVNGILYRGNLFSVLSRFKSSGLLPDQGTIVLPSGDLVPAVGRTLRTTVGNVTVL
jgi:hypothetical protein